LQHSTRKQTQEKLHITAGQKMNSIRPRQTGYPACKKSGFNNFQMVRFKDLGQTFKKAEKLKQTLIEKLKAWK